MSRDVLIVGAGVFGLWCARSCLARGMEVTLVERAGPGMGASGTPVGLLAPHNPIRWSPLKALQLEGLRTLEPALAPLMAETGVDLGYARPGRAVALADPAARQRAADQCAAAAVWDGTGSMRLLDLPPPSLAGLVAPEAYASGWLWDDLTARLDARRCVEALSKSVLPRLDDFIVGQCTGVEDTGARVDGKLVDADHIVLAAGADTLTLAGVSPANGFGEKGQAAILEADMPDHFPVLTAPNLYIVPHGSGRVAVGSTSERSWSHALPDERLDTVLERARVLCPGLADAPVIERWAGIRPRAPLPGPMVGVLPQRPDLWIATGGHKIGYALAHLVGEVVAAGLCGDVPPTIAAHITPIADHLRAVRPHVPKTA